MTKKVGELLAITFWTKVDRVEATDKLLVEDLYTGKKFYVQGNELISSTLSSDEYTKTQKMTKTELAEKLISLYGKPFTVNFDKADGSNRTLRGKLNSVEPLLGRSYVDDLDIPMGYHRLRQIDHRSIHYLIVEGVKYVCKT